MGIFVVMMCTVKVISENHSEMIDITSDINSSIPENFTDGICHVYSGHTTAGLTINENADPDVKKDMIAFLDKLVPWNQSAFKHFEGNSAAHIKASMMGFSVTVPVVAGKLKLGTWQSIYFCEFDGPRQRLVTVCFS
jgi:secondary thiamine-phosphate synthase enzyme